MTEGARRSLPSRWKLSVVWLAIASLGWLTAAVAHGKELDGVNGRVVDASGKGIASARVWVIGGDWDEPAAVAETTTDDRGAFSFPGLWEKAKTKEAAQGFAQAYGLAARDGQGRLGWRTSVLEREKEPVSIELVEPGEAHGRVVDTADKPIAGARIVPALLIRSSAPRSGSDYVRLIPALAESFATTTATDGSFTIAALPKGCQVQATVSARGFGIPRFTWDSSKSATLRLPGSLASIEGRLVTPDGKELSSPISLSFNLTPRDERLPAGTPTLLYYRTLKVAGDGRFRIDDLPPGRYSLAIQDFPRGDYNAEAIPEVDVAPNAKVTDLKIPLKRLATITGRVVDEATGEGIAGVAINAFAISDRFRQYSDQAQTDAQGRYTLHVAPGKLVIQPRPIPKTHLAIDSERCPQLNVSADREWPDLKLPRAVAVDGIVLDGGGKPVAGADVYLVVPDPGGFANSDAPTRTAANGTFRLEQLDPNDTLPVRARTKEATTDGAIVIRPGKQEGRLKLTIDPKYASHVHGVVTDRSGKPIAGVKVSLWWNRSYVSEKTRFSGLGSVLDGYQTDAEGRFASSALWPGDNYKVSIAAEGYGQAESPQIAGRAGDDHDFGTIRLVAMNGHIAGRVVDNAGKPIAGATVFNRGDAPDEVTTQSDDSGKFRLDGLFAGGKYAFARKDGYRFAGRRVEGDADDLTITLTRSDETPPKWVPTEPATVEQEKALATRVLTKLWDRFGKNGDKNGAFVCILHMARIDSSLALKWSAQLGGRFDGRVVQETAEVLAETDGDGALELLTAPGVGSGQYILERLARRFAEDDKDKALKFAAEAAVQARAMEPPDRAGSMARAGALLARLGRREAGLALIKEAADAAERMGTGGRQAYARGNVAGALAPFDANRALALVEPIKAENERDRYLGFVASGLAATDPGRALEVAEKIGGQSSTQSSVKLGIAYALARAGKTDEAVRVLEGMKGHGSEKYQAEGYGWLAVAVAPSDPARAATFIDRGLAGPVDRWQEFRSWTYFGGGTGSAAWIAACAKRAAYPNMAGVVARVFASRPTGQNANVSMDAQSQISAAAILALTDPGAARQMLDELEARSGMSADQLGQLSDRRWYTAWALADPKRAEALFEAEFAARQNEPKLDLQRTGWLKMAEILAQPRHRREEFLRNEISATWFPGRED